jgi:MFS family permease
LAQASLLKSLKNFRGNARGIVFTEPFWGIPFNLYSPFASLFMVALGLADKQIGLLVSIGWVAQIFFALLSGAVTDKLGRKLTTLIFDLLSWSVPAFISAAAQNYWYFLAAALFNATWRITSNSWTCLLVEDSDEKELLDIYAWLYIAGLAAAFFAPLAGLLVKTYTLVPTVRALYIFAGVMFTLKCSLTYLYTKETKQGVIRLQETRHQNVFKMLGEYKGVLKSFLHTPQTLYTTGILFLLGVTSTVDGTFWTILVNQKLHIPAQNLPFFPFIKSIVMLLFFFVMVPRLRYLHFQKPMLIGLAGSIISQVLLVSIPEKSYAWLSLSIILEGCAFAMVSPQVDRMMVVTIEAKERARLQSIMYVITIILSSPFGWIAGMLSERNKNLPFLMNILFFSLGAVLVYFAGRAAKKRESTEEILAEAKLPVRSEEAHG